MMLIDYLGLKVAIWGNRNIYLLGPKPPEDTEQNIHINSSNPVKHSVNVYIRVFCLYSVYKGILSIFSI